MIICINCSPKTKSNMDEMLAKHHYSDYSELIAMAIENLLMLDREMAVKGSLVIGEGTVQPHKDPSPAPAQQEEVTATRRQASFSPLKGKSPGPAPALVHIPDMFLSEGLGELSVPTSNLSHEVAQERTFTLDRWLFGQYNKLLPAKANCRALTRIAAEDPNGALMEKAVSRIAEAAALLGDYLAEHDRRHHVRRDDALATAFPRSASDAEKSRARYANQFIGSVNSQGVLSGLMSDYRLAGLAPGNSPRLLPTEQAVKKARLTNPILDACQTDHTQKFSPEETVFLVDHIRSHVPVEAFAFRTLIQAIANGADRPDSLDEALRSFVPTDTNRSLSPSFLTSQRSGALSRMADLGLVTRIRKGVKVSYQITVTGRAFMESAENKTQKENGRS